LSLRHVLLRVTCRSTFGEANKILDGWRASTSS
jgi:hypothetical protein